MNQNQVPFDEKSLQEAEKFAQILSELSEEDKKIAFHTVNCMLMLNKAHGENQKISMKGA